MLRNLKKTLWKIAPGLVRRLKGPTRWHYSIGIYRGDSPYTLRPAADAKNPVLTRHDVTDTLAGAVADPFLFRGDDR